MNDKWPTQPWAMTLGIGKVQLVDDTGTVQTGAVKTLGIRDARCHADGQAVWFRQQPRPRGSDVIFGALGGQRTKVFALADQPPAEPDEEPAVWRVPAIRPRRPPGAARQ